MLRELLGAGLGGVGAGLEMLCLSSGSRSRLFQQADETRILQEDNLPFNLNVLLFLKVKTGVSFLLCKCRRGARQEALGRP